MSHKNSDVWFIKKNLNILQLRVHPLGTYWMKMKKKKDPIESGPVASTSSQPQPPHLYIISPVLGALEFIHVTI